ncbi:MAG: hypothetical protein HUN04_25430 [Desulfobacter sp.]|nr:MAG: hypothetical protein HUN04_25430 [Desulfobacter sp.]
MVSIEDIVKEILKFNESEFFDADQAVHDSRESRLLDVDYTGMAVNAPGKIDTRIRGKIPLVMAVRLSGDRDWEMRLGANCQVVGTNMANGAVCFAEAFIQDEQERSPEPEKTEESRGPKPPGLALALAQLREIDAKERLNIPWEPGNWTFGLIYYDWASNTVPVELTGEGPAQYMPTRPIFPDPFLEGGGEAPCYLPIDKTPRPPAYGVSFTYEQSSDPGYPFFYVYGSFRFALRVFHLPDDQVTHDYQGAGPQNVAAVVPVTMAVLGVDWDKPLTFEWGVPVYGNPMDLGTVFQGYFSIDADEKGKIRELPPGDYVFYIIADGGIYGPHSFRIS